MAQPEGPTKLIFISWCNLADKASAEPDAMCNLTSLKFCLSLDSFLGHFVQHGQQHKSELSWNILNIGADQLWTPVTIIYYLLKYVNSYLYVLESNWENLLAICCFFKDPQGLKCGEWPVWSKLCYLCLLGHFNWINEITWSEAACSACPRGPSGSGLLVCFFS